MSHRAITVVAVVMGMVAGWSGPSAAQLNKEAIEAATFEQGQALPAADELSPLSFKLQVLLDRARISPGIIDGYYGMNVEVAVRTFAEREGLDSDGQLNAELWDELGGNDTAVLMDYEITQGDVDRPFVDAIPDTYEEMAGMDLLYYTGPEELLAERFHMHVDALRQLNPDADFGQAGTEIVVAAVREHTIMRADVGKQTGQIRSDERDPSADTVARIEVDKEIEQVRGYDRDGNLLVAYPATIGSVENPSPSGTWKVEVVVRDPNYTYRPDSGIEGSNEALQLPPGPNGPVGSIWIGLDKEGYGIHGTSDPAQIRRQHSLGCVRLTNWDAEELAVLVEEGAVVEFLDNTSGLKTGNCVGLSSGFPVRASSPRLQAD
jgi:lipoprotein-anchoring transpeptidase ErfK/SrfK